MRRPCLYDLCFSSCLQLSTGWQSLLTPLSQWTWSVVCLTTRTTFELSSTSMVSRWKSKRLYPLSLVWNDVAYARVCDVTPVPVAVFLRWAVCQRIPHWRVDPMGRNWLERLGLRAHPVGGVTGRHSGWNTIGCSQTQRDVHSASDHQWKGEESGRRDVGQYMLRKLLSLCTVIVSRNMFNDCLSYSSSWQRWAVVCMCTTFWWRWWWPTGRLLMTLISYTPCCCLIGNIFAIF